MNLIKSLYKNEDGATAIEYGLIAALIAVACITALTNLGGEMNETFTTVETKMNDANKDDAAPAKD
jgi:pilus assembly protein Flp/PilA